jgi:hypothetical protein
MKNVRKWIILRIDYLSESRKGEKESVFVCLAKLLNNSGGM